jgi:sulfur-carrier protein
MPVIFIPPLVRDLTQGVDQLEVQATSVRRAMDELEVQFPGIRERLCDGDELRPGLSVSVDGRITSMGLYQRIPAEAEVHFIPSIGGG